MKFEYREVPEPPFNIKYPKDFEESIHAGLLHYVIYDRFRKVAHCTTCGHTWSYREDGITVRKGDRIECPHCGREHTAMPHTAKDVYTEYYQVFIWNERSSIRFAAVYAFYRYDEQMPELTADTVKILPFQTGSISGKAQKNYVLRWSYDAYKATGKDQYRWAEPGDMRIDYVGWNIGLHPKVFKVLDRSFMKRIYPKWLSKYPDTFIRTLALYAKYPSAEFLDKAGSDLYEIAQNKIDRTPSYVWPNWRAKTMPKFFGLSAQDIDKLRSWNAFDIKGIAMYKQLKKHRKNPKREQYGLLRSWYGYPDEFTNKHSGYFGENYYEIALYWQRQQNRIGIEKWRIKDLYGDYRRQMAKLDYPLDDYYKYPKDIVEAHDRITEEYRAKEQEKRDAAARARAEKLANDQKEFEDKLLPALEALIFDDGEFTIFPLRNHDDFLGEGKMQHNCVASYYERAIKGKTKIFVMRASSDLTASLITIELSTDNKTLKQVYARGNRIPEPELKAKVEWWHENIVMKKKARKTA